MFGKMNDSGVKEDFSASRNGSHMKHGNLRLEISQRLSGINSFYFFMQRQRRDQIKLGGENMKVTTLFINYFY